MSNLNNLLERQLQSNNITKDKLPGDIISILKVVSETYTRFERDLKLSEQALLLTSKEIRESYEKRAIQTELQRSNKELQQFVSVASHDLKAPLRTIGSFAKLLEKKLEGKLDKDAEEFLYFISYGVQSMETLLKDLLAFAKIGARTEIKERVDFNTVLDVVKKNLNFAIGQSSASIRIEGVLPVYKTYPYQVLQLFQNLIGNAIKYRSEAPPVITIRSKIAGDKNIISITDNGEGINQQYHKKAFEPFCRLTLNNKISGTGLGLSICKKIVTGWGGEIWFESEIGKGTSFFFTVPLDEASKDKKASSEYHQQQENHTRARAAS